MMSTMKNTAFSLCVIAQLFQSAHSQACYRTTKQIRDAESARGNSDIPQIYTLCPRTEVNVGTYDFDFELNSDDSFPPLQLRSNMHVRCGDDGSPDNLCTFIGGDYQIDATSFLGIDDDAVHNVVVEGITFIGAKQYSFWGSKQGDITFKNCEWKSHVQTVVPLLLDYTDTERPNTQLSVTFEDCRFTENRFFGLGSNTALVYGNGAQNHLNVARTIFENNDMLHNNTLAETRSFLIETLGPLTVEKSCFLDNAIGVSSVAVFGNTLSSDTNFEFNSRNTETNSDFVYCEFAAVFQTLQQFQDFTPICVQATASMCMAFETPAPTTTPSVPPTIAPSASPTMSPSNSPTGGPTGAPTLLPTTSTEAPSTSPSVAPSATPSATPSASPTSTPTSLPTEQPVNISPSEFEFPTASPAPTEVILDRANSGVSSIYFMSAIVGAMAGAAALML